MLSAPFASAETLRVLTFSGGASQFDAFLYLKDGEPTGLEYEILRYFATAQGHELEVIWLETFAELLPALERGEGDIAAATLTITSERQAQFDFTEPYLPTQLVLIESRENEGKSLAGATVATMRGTSSEEALQAVVPNARFVYGDSTTELLELVVAGKARATAIDSALALPRLEHFGSLHVTAVLREEKGLAFALPKGSPLTNDLNDHLAKLRASGIYFRLLKEYLGDDAVQLVQAAKASP
jgi:polar amino acid transport system substrate-binding protein